MTLFLFFYKKIGNYFLKFLYVCASFLGLNSNFLLDFNLEKKYSFKITINIRQICSVANQKKTTTKPAPP